MRKFVRFFVNLTTKIIEEFEYNYQLSHINFFFIQKKIIMLVITTLMRPTGSLQYIMFTDKKEGYFIKYKYRTQLIPENPEFSPNY